MLTGSMGLGHALFPAVSTGTLLNVLFDGLTSSSLTRASVRLPMNNQPAFQVPSELFLTWVCVWFAGTFPKVCLIQSKFRSPCSSAKMLCITDTCQVQMRLARSCQILLSLQDPKHSGEEAMPSYLQTAEVFVRTKPGISSDLLSCI